MSGSEAAGPAASPVTCSASSLALGEPLVATASKVTAWLLIEQPGPWGADALTESRQLDQDVGAALAAAGRMAGVRVLLLRRPGRTTPGERARHVFAAHTGVRGRWVERLEPADPAGLLGIDLRALRRPEPPGLGDLVTRPLLLVCTNGRHDRCCADRGRPLALALAAGGHGDLVWECSHIGGDRFAGNLVCLPEGIYFGRVGPAEAERVAGAYLDGRIDLDHYRGRSCYAMLVQAAEDAIRRHWDLTGIGDLVLTGRKAVGHGEIVTRWAGLVGTYLARVRAVPAEPPRPLTCHSAGVSRPPAYEVVELRAESAA